MMMRGLLIFVALVSLSTIAFAQTNGTIIFTLSALTCNGTSQKRGDSCRYNLNIAIPAGNSTTMYLEVFPSDLNSSLAQLCKPTINYNSTQLSFTLPQPVMLSDYLSKSQFDRAVLDFGTVKNLNSMNTSYIDINFNVVVIGNVAVNNQTIWVSTGVEYYSGSEAWVGQSSFTFNISAEPASTTPTLIAGPATTSIQIGKTGQFEFVFTGNMRYYSLMAIATSNSTDISVCSIHVKSADTGCYDCLNSVKAALSSTSATSSAALDLGFLVNSGINNANSNNTITFLLTYKVLTTAKVNSNYGVTLTVQIGNNTYNTNLSSSSSFTVIATANETSANNTPTVVTTFSKIDSTPASSININEPFKLSFRVTIPTDFDNYLRLDVVGNTTDGTPRMKICNVNISSSGENVPCRNCLNYSSQYSYSGSIQTTANDRMTWEVINVKNINLRPISENSSANDIVFDIYGQLINNTNNLIDSNISVIACLTYGSQSLWLAETFFYVGVNTNYSTDNASIPEFSMDYYDTYGNSSVDFYQTRQIYLDIVTQPGAIYQPITVEVAVPETVNGSKIPAGTICRVKVISVGKFASCVQPGVINYDLNGFVTYQANMVQYKNDKAIVYLGSVCNIGTAQTQTSADDGRIRFLLSFQMEYDATAVETNYVGASIQYTPTEIYVGQALLTNKLNTPINTLPISHVLYYYFNTTSSVQNVSSGGFGLANLVFKVPPNTKNIYNFESSIKSSLISGTASFCTMRYTSSGDNVPCRSLMNQNYNYMPATTNRFKFYDYVYAGFLCSISNKSLESYTQTWDDDSVNIEISTKTSLDAVGSYTLTFTAYNGVYNTSFTPATFTWNVLPNSNITSDVFAITSSSNVSFISIDLNSNTTTSNTDFYKGQTTILRYDIIMNESKSFDLSISINSSLPIDTFHVQRFFISHIGDNLPCTFSKSQPSIYLSGVKYNYASTLNVGPFCYYPIDPNNITSSTLSVEAHIRIPTNSSLPDSSSVNFTITSYLNSIINPILTQTINGLVQNPLLLSVPLNSKNITLATTANTPILLIHNNLTFTSVLCIPAYTSARTVFKFQSIDNTTKSQFGDITSASILSVGQNIDGFADDYFKWQFINAAVATNYTPAYYNDTVEFDLGIVTNTQYGQKVGTYNSSSDDCITFSINVMVTDNPILNNLVVINAPTTVTFLSSDVPTKLHSIPLTVNRTGNEKSVMNFQVNLQNPSTTYSSNTSLTVNFMLQHDQTTTAEAYNITIRFFFPPYAILTNSTSGNLTSQMLSYANPVLYFGQTAGGSFSLMIDPGSTYAKNLQSFGYVPSLVEIPYTVEFQKYSRTGDTPGLIYFTPMSTLTYSPQKVVLVYANISALKSKINKCQITASVNNPMASLVFTTGWRTDYRADAWYQSSSNYLTVAFGNLTEVNRIVIKQYLASQITTPFKKFRLSYSYDNISFAFLPEESYPTASIPAPFTYVMPNGNIKCNYLRIHITSIETPSDLTTKNSGFIIDEIYGDIKSGGVPLSNVCPSGQVPDSPYYASRSVLYVPSKLVNFVCDENTDRKSGTCFMGSNSQSNNWQILPPTVSSIVFWTYDNELFVERLYGVGYDKKTHVRSDDDGLTWKSVSTLEFTTVLTNAQNNNKKFTLSYYNPLPTTTLTSLNLTGEWTVSPSGVSYNTLNVVDWFN